MTLQNAELRRCKRCNALLTKDEDQMQFALQVVKEHRKCFPDSKKSTLLQGLAASTSTHDLPVSSDIE